MIRDSPADQSTVVLTGEGVTRGSGRITHGWTVITRTARNEESLVTSVPLPLRRLSLWKEEEKKQKCPLPLSPLESTRHKIKEVCFRKLLK